MVCQDKKKDAHLVHISEWEIIIIMTVKALTVMAVKAVLQPCRIFVISIFFLKKKRDEKADGRFQSLKVQR